MSVQAFRPERFRGYGMLMNKNQPARAHIVYWSFPIFRPLAEVRLLKPGIQRRWLAKNAPLPFRLSSRFFNRFPVALPLRCFHLEEVSSVTAELARAERSEGIAEGEA